MATILNIETSGNTASICISGNGIAGKEVSNPARNDQAAWLHKAIHDLAGEENLHLKQLDAIAVSIGPGSYTGLRIGLSTAKGICYALKLPLITIGTLTIMAASVDMSSCDLACPMMDARRMEVYTALYDKQLSEIISPTAMILHEDSFADYLINNKIKFFGTGSAKFKSILSHPHASFLEFEPSAAMMAGLAEKFFTNKEFADLAYVEPLYLKNFYSSSQIK